MTVEFIDLREYNKKLSDEQIKDTLLSYDTPFFTGWLEYNKYVEPKKDLPHYLFNYPAILVDEIGAKLREIHSEV